MITPRLDQLMDLDAFRARHKEKAAEARAAFAQMRGTKPEPGELDPERFDVAVTENISMAGFRTTQYLKYRWTVTDKETGTALKVGYAFSTRLAQADARTYVAKLIAGKKRLK
jgi:hypothetical protein